MLHQINNWDNSLKINHISSTDKIKQLLLIKYKLVLCQVHELERIKTKCRSNYIEYVDNLYKHYIVNKGPKTYLCE